MLRRAFLRARVAGRTILLVLVVIVAIDDLNETFLEMDALGVPATHTSRLRNEQGTLRRSTLHTYHVHRTESIPSAFLLSRRSLASSSR